MQRLKNSWHRHTTHRASSTTKEKGVGVEEKAQFSWRMLSIKSTDVTLINDGDIPVMVSVKMIKCCEQLFTSYDENCKYPYNRKGICNVDISIYINQSKISRYLQNITFDTTKKPEDVFLLQESMFKFDTNFKLCESPDEDPLDFCAPVNCHMKYQGFRSLFDAIKRQCISIPICNRRLNNENSSNIVYDPYSNDCIALTDKISITDIDCILNVIEDKNKFKNKKTKFLYQSNIRCYRGKMDEINRSCICDDGWTSSLNMNFTIVTTVPVYACTVQVQKNLTIDVGSKLFDSLAGFLSEIRNEFYNYESVAREKFPDSDYKDLHQRTKKRSIHLTFPGEQTNENIISFSSSEKFKIETYFPIIDTLITQLEIRDLRFGEARDVEAKLTPRDKFSLLGRNIQPKNV
ncbi:hypothetical protein ACI65C_010323 [Semiaphis heraclei]